MQELKETSAGSEAANVPRPPPVASPATTTGASSVSSSKPPPSRIQHFLNSGSKKHVFVGLLIVSAVTCAPWFLLTSGAKHQNHADYMDQAEKAEKARQSRLSTSSDHSEAK
ncbi:hypothetical protein MPTK1_4g20170 [Marchantia polymorpha subsp. ruderalis]|uniref:Transmembrane protein n=2 Tax=Marchantia polymorpha TaxID=3197 RepID=A0A176VPX6_MARPO|nr:hypothetical protein AXG93_2997s1030 [Marchantia polymorpha subsp. ruderalis]PTQ31030.1 hypothetical protein MARPO_0116s0019 [Marchantia polymorpha]BBN09494.1 hypothetical protein Mp_4g20170 [Marchantia polymorpha subsp. ruderalis]|eukprot:PTQ31030.1 hypothetical protein MARPO_0116s0019 [Marchantia polymorpha]